LFASFTQLGTVEEVSVPNPTQLPAPQPDEAREALMAALPPNEAARRRALIALLRALLTDGGAR
jgi:hypothetical protein